MTRTLIVVVAVGALLGVSLSAASAQQVICNKVGNQTICSNGQTFNTFGNVTIDNQGRILNSFGNQTISNQGDIYTRQGSHVFDNRGNSWNVIDSQQVGPTGKKCTLVGTQVLCR
jgi:hypothetical protein